MQVQSKVEKPGNDLISQLATKKMRDEGQLTQEQLVQTAFLLLVAGNATTVSMIALGVLTLLKVKTM
jgi:nitric oxide reductase